jgi:15-cis-phytoene synthase
MSMSLSPSAPVSDAYRDCEAITRAAAANFYYGIRLLAPERRRAMCAVYAFARRVDDIGDGDLAATEKLRRLEEQAGALAQLGERRADSLRADPQGADLDADAVMIALGDAYQRFDVPADALPALIAGVRMDVEGVRYESFEDLVVYCRRVAGAIGRACLAIFALRDPTAVDRARAERLADDLGVALQVTNILRDVREDAQRGRVYLPAEDLRRFGVTSVREAAEAEAAERARWEALVRFQAERAREWFDRGIALAPLLDRRSAACLLAMAGIYSRLLHRIAADPDRVLRERVALPVREKAWVATRSMLGIAT